MSKFSTTTNEHSLLSQLYKAHYSWLYYWLLKKMDGAAQAEDVLQDTFIKILRAGDTLNIQKPKSYLIKTATRIIIDQKRRKVIEQAYLEYLQLNGAQYDDTNPEQVIIAIETLDRIAMMLDGLPERVRKVFLARYLEGHQQMKIAEDFAISRRTVQLDLIKALQHCDAILSS
ncbi:sigma-70 family RNA polymerase sigma factor [Acinetobacter rudis]|uniref:sigma-70 family RNA polymerase sigma factor n=1 Tax=Acinetobacter rudis TaxID=632955 RepID=UPI00334190B7